MDKKLLEELGLDETQVNAVLKEHKETLRTKAADIRDRDETIKTLEEKLSTANDQLSSFNTDDIEALKNELNAEKEGRAKDRQGFTLKSLLTGAGCKDIDYLMYKIGNSAKFDDDGNIIESDAFISSLKEQYASQFEEAAGANVFAPGNPTVGAVNNTDLSKLSYAQLTEYLTQNPTAELK